MLRADEHVAHPIKCFLENETSRADHYFIGSGSGSGLLGPMAWPDYYYCYYYYSFYIRLGNQLGLMIGSRVR